MWIRLRENSVKIEGSALKGNNEIFTVEMRGCQLGSSTGGKKTAPVNSWPVDPQEVNTMIFSITIPNFYGRLRA